MVGPDKGWSWVIAFSCCFASLVLAGIFRTSGVLFVAFISEYQVTREEAAWPMVVCIAVLNLTGPFSGILGQKFGCRPIIFIGCLTATTGIASCFFTTSLKTITLLFGGVFGIGYGFMNTLLPVVLNSYFLNLRATANGIANSGSCIGSMVLPVVYEYLIDAYGLSGCFLLTAGIVLHIAAVATLMRPPPWLQRTRSYQKVADSDTSPHSLQLKTMNEEEMRSFEGATNETVANDLQCSSKCDDPENMKLGTEIVEACSNTLQSKMENSKISLSGKTKTDDGLNEVVPSAISGCIQSKIASSFVSVLTCPMFYVTAITNVSFYFIYHMYVVIIVDYALDVEVLASNTKYILFAFSISDLIGRLSLGWVTDRKLVTRPRFVMGCMTMIGFVFFTFPFANNFGLLVTVSCCYGFLLGCTMVVFPILLLDFCGEELLAVAYGCMCFMNGFSSFGRPFLIGYFRDNAGSYSSIFFILGIISVTASMLWLLERCFVKDRKNRLPCSV
ncbi:monocarboxylate transporter 9-like [Uloborus diversus]|uniref:monocarboxylate transporter 9-like n=1 Tax=Uloborus diversus TaxID=327109 RepID=UPI00240932A1|nr:monocarboxylate transporter 9-like [Uloborus diversus]XP_054721711.1 monocarboxylate transporter 9-like [Uloborus diversus]